MMTQTGEAHRLPVLKERHLPGECRQSVTELLKETYGYDGFRNLEIYDDLFKNRDTLCISQGQLVENVIREAEKAYKGGEQPDNILLTAPTGAGKSLLFQLPAIYLGKEYNLLTIVVSPLKALIVDQVEGLQDVGYERVAYASSDLSPEQKMEVYRAVREGEIDLFYLSPELLLSYDIRHFIGNRRIGMVVVDEAHTVTTWGKEFRVDYWFLGRYLGALKQNLGYSFPLFALTATAVWNPKGGNDMVFDTIRSLQMEPCILYVGTVRRKNIGFDIRRLTLEEGETYDKGKQRVISGRVEEFLDGHKHAVLLDNNVLASAWGLMQIEKIVRMDIRVDFNQGLDARRIARTPEIAALLARVKWIRFLRMAYDSRAMQDDVHKAIELLRKHGVPARKLFFYVLIRDDTEDALGRIRELKALGCQPFAQPYRDFEHEGKPSREQWRLAYWCNRKPLFYSVDYEEYRKKRT